MDVNWLAIIAAGLSSLALGGLWYSVLFGKSWLQASGLTIEEARSINHTVVFGGAFLLSMTASWMFAVFLGKEIDAVMGAAYGFAAGLFWVGTSFGINYLFEKKSIKLFLINGGYHTLQFTLIGLILGAWQ